MQNPTIENNFEDMPMIFVVIGEARLVKGGAKVPFNALLAAPDDDTAVHMVLESLAQEGYHEADLHQIGNLDERPEKEEFLAAYESAQAGEIALIVYESDDTDHSALTLH